jgi:hypothetical protein
VILGAVATAAVAIVAISTIAAPIHARDHRAQAASIAAAPPDTSPPPVTANEFFPEQRDVTDCIGVLERPGCGSESRGGWRQLLVFGVIAVGLVVVFGKITIEVRRRGRAQAEQHTPPHT